MTRLGEQCIPEAATDEEALGVTPPFRSSREQPPASVSPTLSPTHLRTGKEQDQDFGAGTKV